MNQPLIKLSTVIHIIILSREMPFLRTSFSVAVTFKNSIKNNFQAKNIHVVVQVIQVSLFVLFFDYVTDFITNLIASITVQLQLCLRKGFSNEIKVAKITIDAAMIASPFQSSLTTSVKSCTLRFHSFVLLIKSESELQLPCRDCEQQINRIFSMTNESPDGEGVKSYAENF